MYGMRVAGMVWQRLSVGIERVVAVYLLFCLVQEQWWMGDYDGWVLMLWRVR